jgi:hypothetical protein
MKIYIIIAMFMAASMVSGGVYYYYTSTQAKIEQLTQYNATLMANVEQMEQVNKQNIATINNLQAGYQQAQENFAALQNNFTEIRRQNNELRDRLGKHELDVLAAAKPGLVEKILNSAAEKAMRCFELESGSVLTDKEKEAKNARAFNSECPWIYDRLVASGMLTPSASGTTTEDNNGDTNSETSETVGSNP